MKGTQYEYKGIHFKRFISKSYEELEMLKKSYELAYQKAWINPWDGNSWALTIENNKNNSAWDSLRDPWEIK